nr:hypothetical protein [Pseudanabaena sp. PCC 7367]
MEVGDRCLGFVLLMLRNPQIKPGVDMIWLLGDRLGVATGCLGEIVLLFVGIADQEIDRGQVDPLLRLCANCS